MLRKARLIFAVCVCLLLSSRPAGAYSVLTHEQLIDLTWKSTIVPLLLSRYPTLTPEQIEHARAYAYGGCVIQDIGYYPFGDAFFSDLTHYVRSGDFIVNLFRNAGNADELAFAAGALSHYIGDNIGHSTATNLAVPVEFPKLGKKYGKSVNYAQGERQHVQTEFAFDINEIAHGRFAPVHYLRHVGLELPTKQLSLAFYQTYGLREDFSDTGHRRLNLSAYRFAVHHFIPRIAYAVTLLHRKHEPLEISNPDVLRLDAAVAQVAQDNDWDAYRKKPGIGTYSLAGVIAVMPKIGALKLAAVKGPSAETELEYVHSVLRSVDALDAVLRRFTPPPALGPMAGEASATDSKLDKSSASAANVPAKAGASQVVPRQSSDPRHPLINRDLDTGSPVKPAGYRLTDATYALLLHRLTLTPTVPVPPGIKDDILAYYKDQSLPFATKKDPQLWAATVKDVTTLQGMPISTEPVPYPTYGDGDGNSEAPDASGTPSQNPSKAPADEKHVPKGC